MINTLWNLIEIPSITGTPEEAEIHSYLHSLLEWIIDSHINKSWVSVKILENKAWENVKDFYWYISIDIDVDPSYDRIALMWHYDVVPVSENWDSDPFKMKEIDGKLYGRWSCDMKSWLAIMIEILEESLKRKPSKNIKLLFTSDEETWEPNGLSSVLGNNWMEWVDFAIALEPTNNQINAWVFGYMDAEFLFTWVPCHSSTPQLWENAIYKSWPLITEISSQPSSLIQPVYYNNQSLNEALSITRITWGRASNIIPDEAVVQTNYRYSPERDGSDVERIFQEIAKRVGAKVKIIEHNPASEISNLDNRQLQNFMASIWKRVKDIVLVPFWSDMAQVSRRGIPSINYWPWSIKQAHQDNEYIEKNELESTYANFIKYLFN